MQPTIHVSSLAVPTHLEYPLGQSGLLRELLQILGVGIVVDREVGLHGAELVVFEGRPHPLRPLVGAVHPGSTWRSSERHVQVVRI
jgi:hypothetical protein